jgi:glycogen(starch) synthase
MKILHLIYDHINNPWVAGGGAVRVCEIYKRLSKKHSITVVCGKYPNAEDYKEGNVNFHFAGINKDNYILSTFIYAIKAASFLKSNKNNFDIVIEDFAPYNPILSFLQRKDAIIQLHQKEGFQHIRKYGPLGIPFFLIEKLYPRFFRNYITISEISKKKFRLTNNVVVVANGFDTSLLDMEIMEKDYVLYLGRLHINQKGLDTLLQSLKYIKYSLVIAGGGKDRLNVQKMFREHINSGTVKMAGFIKGTMKMDLLRNCIFMVMPSRYEGQPLTLIEAAACRKPVIVSDIAELRYAVDAGFGISFKKDDAYDLAEKIGFMLKNELIRKEMGRKAREYAKNFTWDRVAEEFEDFLIKNIKKG